MGVRMYRIYFVSIMFKEYTCELFSRRVICISIFEHNHTYESEKKNGNIQSIDLLKGFTRMISTTSAHSSEDAFMMHSSEPSAYD